MYLFISLVMLVAPMLASASDDVIKCNPNGLQDELNVCASEEFSVADKALNEAYKAVLKKEADNKLFIRKLKAAQKAWIEFRDADLEARFTCDENDVQVCWGTMYYRLHLSRKTALTRERTAHLRQILKDGIGE